MSTLSRWDPFREMVDMRRAMDQLIQNAFTGQETVQQMMALPMDVSETGDAYEINISMPGVKPDDVEITLNNNTLTIRGEIREEQEDEGRTYHIRERRMGSFLRSITFPTTVNSDTIEARYESGILRLRVPKAEEAKPKRIQVHSQGEESRMIEGQAGGQ